MRVCDICGQPAEDQITFTREDQVFDVCLKHRQTVMEELHKVPKKKGRTKKDSG